MLIASIPVLIYRIIMQCINGVSSPKATSVASMRLRNGEIKQAQFVEDGSIMLLYAGEGKTVI